MLGYCCIDVFCFKIPQETQRLQIFFQPAVTFSFRAHSGKVSPCVRSRLSETVFLSSFSSLLSLTHSRSRASSSS